MKTPNSSKVAAGEKHEASEVITPKMDSLYNDAGMSGIMTRSRLKQLCDNSGKLYGNSVNSANMRRALLRCFEDLPGTASQESTCPSNKKLQKNKLLEAGSVTPSDNDSVIRESQNLRIERSLKSDDDEQDCINAHKSVSVALYNASETESPFVTVTVSGLCNNMKAAIKIHEVNKGNKEVCDTDFKVNSSLLATNDDEQSPKHSKKEKKAIKSRKKSRPSLDKNEWTVTEVSEHITECGNESDVVKFPQESDEVPLRNTELINGPSVSSTNDELSPNNSQKERQIKKSRKSKSPPPNKNGSDFPTAQEHITELENEMCKVKTLQKFEKCKNQDNPIMTVSQLPAEIEECPKSVVVIGERETQLKNLSNTESALADKACGVNNTSDSDSETRQVESNHNAKSSPLLQSKKTKEVRSESSESDSDAESRKAIMESAQRRIIQNISTSESESKKYVRPRTVSTGSDTSDSVPEAMSFSAGRQLVMESWQNAADSIQRENQRRKEKRKERLEKYKQQKEEKLIRLKEKRASQEDASCSSSEESGYEEVDVPSVLEKSNKKAGIKWKKENLDDLSHSKVKRFHSDDEGEPKGVKAKKRKNEQKDPSQYCGNLGKLPDDVLENLPDQVPMKLQKTDSAATSEGKRSHEKHAEDKRQKYKNQHDTDYIPLSTCGATEFGVMPLDKFMRAPKSMAERAAEFRQNMLFGTRIRRGPANAQAIYQHKLKASGKGRFLR